MLDSCKKVSYRMKNYKKYEYNSKEKRNFKKTNRKQSLEYNK